MIRRRPARSAAAATGIALALAATLAMPASADTATGTTDRVGARHAASAPGTQALQLRPVRMTAVPASGRVSCYGYYGTFRAGTYVAVVDWESTSDECFGIATDRTIWHAWPNSGGWKPMPGNGHADFIDDVALEDPDIPFRDIAVIIPGAANPYWCQSFYEGAWQGWYNCS